MQEDSATSPALSAARVFVFGHSTEENGCAYHPRRCPALPASCWSVRTLFGTGTDCGALRLAAEVGTPGAAPRSTNFDLNAMDIDIAEQADDGDEDGRAMSDGSSSEDEAPPEVTAPKQKASIETKLFHLVRKLRWS